MNSRLIRVAAWISFFVLISALLILLYKKSGLFPATKTELPQKEEVTGAVEKVIPVDVRVKQDHDAYATALSEGSEAACNQIKFDEALKQKCLDGIRYTGIINRRNAEDCEQLLDPGTRRFCVNKIYFLKAVDALDASLCEKIQDAKLKTDCLDQINIFVNANRQTRESCEQIQNEALRKTCLDQYYYQSGTEKRALSDCSRIENRILQDRCLKVVAKTPISPDKTTATPQDRREMTSEEKLKGCQNISGEEQNQCKDEANYQLAFNKKDLAYCNLITDAALKAKCRNVQENNINRYYLQLAIAKKDPSLCQKIIREDARTTCLTYVKP